MMMMMMMILHALEINVNIRMENALTAIDTLSVIWKSNLSDKTKWGFFEACHYYYMDAQFGLAQSVGAVEYTDFSAEG